MRLVFRADGNATIGLGHIVRSLALASMVRAGENDYVLARNPSGVVKNLVQDAGLRLVELPECALQTEADYLSAQFLNATDIVVLDGYAFDYDYQQRIKSSGCRLVCIDDLHQGQFVADLVINHSPGITADMYHGLPTTRFCLGPAYSLLRPPFLQHSQLPRATAPIHSILLCFGGADPLQLTDRCAAMLLSAYPSIRRLGVVMGGAAATSSAITALQGAYPATEVEEFRGLSAAAMVQVLANYDAIICPASTILIEALVLGVPAITGYYVDNQHSLADYVQQNYHAYSVGNFVSLTDSELHDALQQGLEWLTHASRQPYVGNLSPEQLQYEFRLLQSTH
ncbi:UDP-2,4-diacetamido-2,4,6-trideoxy-beta-L-altropyranose hydrolase [Hymenobacter mucosus]|uniref:UDP-2,4-diacetamido-2,4,6-trideoxy-beta-L-altropyranose hydrolase n=1 Tax=Hymenobacter mucosus TaxID=1411120 RepID=A0A238VG80_9BACT|nr:UDP-2,4-diacetamido-2,4,6-trideoxy-beta-L-altropyranose hydrolase [Hymenobacter mucosus]SNR33164.1 UDP-2,4-diacetamido-2,4,6-trideoxy-beta-L-altropyranose hydrolase [Hymenobacter mucosus]